VAIVTGGALGLGEVSARMLARERAKVMVTDIKYEEGERVAQAIVEAGGEAIYLHHDVAVESAWEQVMQTALDRFGRFDVLVNNAGVGWGGPPEEEMLERRPARRRYDRHRSSGSTHRSRQSETPAPGRRSQRCT
jgi:3(or 17)beta-hydroxysteroid dehydrogenase